MLDTMNLVALAKAAAKAEKFAPVAYSYEGKNFSTAQVNDTLRAELAELVGSPSLYRENKNTLFTIIEEVVGEVVPKKVEAMYATLAETKVFGQGEKPLFRRRVNAKLRAKQFITRVGLAGVYEVFKLGGSESFEVPTSAVGGAAQIGIEEFLDGQADFAELIQIVIDGIQETIQLEVGEALIAGINQLPEANRVNFAGFDATEFDRLLVVADSYGSGKATIYADAMFAVKLMPAAIKADYLPDAMKTEILTNGYLKTYKDHQIVILPNAVADETNTTLALEPGYAWIMPAGVDKPVRIAFEGETMVDERKNADWSRDVHAYKKVGVAAMLTSDICVYHDTSLSKVLYPKVEG